MTTTSTEVERLTTQHMVGSDLFDSVCSVLALNKAASQQHTAVDARDFEKLFVGKPAIDIEFRKFREDMQAKNDSI